MKKLTAAEILQIVKENYEISSFAYGYFTATKTELLTEAEIEELKANNTMSLYWSNYEKNVLEKLGLGEVEEVSQYGGEGMGEEWYSVKFFKDHGVYIKTVGYYQSYDGTDFDNYGYEVVPQEKVITVYKRIGK